MDGLKVEINKEDFGILQSEGKISKKPMTIL